MSHVRLLTDRNGKRLWVVVPCFCKRCQTFHVPGRLSDLFTFSYANVGNPYGKNKENDTPFGV